MPPRKLAIPLVASRRSETVLIRIMSGMFSADFAFFDIILLVDAETKQSLIARLDPWWSFHGALVARN